ncbi:MAG: methyltransferase [Vampirovibrionales bacterium]|nr:methyltransferase [Vampirovibrionales bacterium]
MSEESVSEKTGRKKTADPQNGTDPRHSSFWQSRYQSQNWPWDLGQASPHFKLFFNTDDTAALLQPIVSPLGGPKKTALVPGAGRGHDGAYLVELGFAVTCVDYAPGALETARLAYPDLISGKLKQMDYQVKDIFSLANQDAYHTRFDLLLEHTCFCAIPPNRRGDYVRMAEAVLKPGGFLLGVFWQHSGPDDDGPPFSVTPATVADTFQAGFDCRYQISAPAVCGRSGTETLMLWQRHSD